GDVTKRDVYQLKFLLPDKAEPLTALRLEVLPHASLPAGGPGMAFYEGRRGDFFLSELTVKLDGKPVNLEQVSHSFGKISVGSGSAAAANVIDGNGSTGWSTSGKEGEANRLVVNFQQPLAGPGELEVELLFERHFAAALGRFRISVTGGPQPAVAMSLPQELGQNFEAAASSADSSGGSISQTIYQSLQRHFVRTATELKDQRKKLEQLRRRLPQPVRTLAMRQRAEQDYRVTHRHHRGEYLQPKEEVSPAVPAMFAPLAPSQPADRLALARWLVSEKNVLVGRVTVNRAWREFFGVGIVRTAGDFGTQSEPPTHPQLLDWLAEDLRQSGWSMKRLHRQIVLSSTYRQSIGRPPAQDPDNRLLSCFTHRRLSAEQIRDVMLSASGLLDRKVGGASVYPPQPASVTQIAYGSPKWNISTGGDRYRRSLYTFSKRTAPFAAFTTFDGPTGELCVARRQRSTTPLQALTLLNDAMYLEIARGLAKSAIADVGSDATAKQIATRIFRRMLSRWPQPGE
ncbi:MAG: DUF1553 domain-containing protein, partial [Pirellulales bacterium]|nr:DUF1553 domain-containing protein [Pirellulales bacterium]